MSLVYVSICIGLLALAVAIGGPLLLVVIALLANEVSAGLQARLSMLGRNNSTRADQSTAQARKHHRFEDDLPNQDSSPSRRSGRDGPLPAPRTNKTPRDRIPRGFVEPAQWL